MAIRVMVHAKITEGSSDKFEAAYREVSRAVKGTPGHVRDELLRAAGDDCRYILLSEWESQEQFLAWEDAPIHRQTTSGMRPYWAADVDRIIYEVTPSA